MAGETPRGEVGQLLHVGVDTCTPGVAGRGYTKRVAHVHTGTRGTGAALVGGYAAEDRCLEKKEGCVSALHPTTGQKRTFLSKSFLYRFCDAVNFVRARSSASRSLRSVARLYFTGSAGPLDGSPRPAVQNRVELNRTVGALTPGRTESSPSTGGPAYCTQRSAAALSRPNRAGVPPRSAGDVAPACD